MDYRLANETKDVLIGLTDSELLNLAGSDSIWGSHVGGSLHLRAGNSSDEIRLYSGLNNNINGNQGQDMIYLESTTPADGIIKGGIGDDFIRIISGNWGMHEGSIINGNGGDDLISVGLLNGSSAKALNLHGGAGSDTFQNIQGISDVWGDKGRDIFKPEYAGNEISSFMRVMDFNPMQGDQYDFGPLMTSMRYQRDIENIALCANNGALIHGSNVNGAISTRLIDIDHDGRLDTAYYVNSIDPTSDSSNSLGIVSTLVLLLDGYVA